MDNAILNSNHETTNQPHVILIRGGHADGVGDEGDTGSGFTFGGGHAAPANSGTSIHGPAAFFLIAIVIIISILIRIFKNK